MPLSPEAEAMIHLIMAQWDRRLFVPDDLTHVRELREALAELVAAGLAHERPYHKGGPVTVFGLTDQGALLWGKLAGYDVVFT